MGPRNKYLGRSIERESGGGDAGHEFVSAEAQPAAQESQKQPELEGELLPVRDVAEVTGYSRKQLQALLKDGKVDGVRGQELRWGKLPWFTSAVAVQEYRTALGYGTPGSPEERSHSELTGELLPVTDLAERTGFDRKNLGRILRKGLIPGVLGGPPAHGGRRQWFSTVEAVEKYKSGRQRPWS